MIAILAAILFTFGVMPIGYPSGNPPEQAETSSNDRASTTDKPITCVSAATPHTGAVRQSSKKKKSVKEKKKKIYKKYYDEQDAIDIAKLLYAECGSVKSKTEQACVAWALLNRVDMTGSSIHYIIRRPKQYAFYQTTKVDKTLLSLAYDVLERWNKEKNGDKSIGRVLPKDYIYFSGDGKHNYFRNKYKGNYTVWDYSLQSPYNN